MITSIGGISTNAINLGYVNELATTALLAIVTAQPSFAFMIGNFGPRIVAYSPMDKQIAIQEEEIQPETPHGPEGVEKEETFHNSSVQI